MDVGPEFNLIRINLNNCIIKRGPGARPSYDQSGNPGALVTPDSGPEIVIVPGRDLMSFAVGVRTMSPGYHSYGCLIVAENVALVVAATPDPDINRTVALHESADSARPRLVGQLWPFRFLRGFWWFWRNRWGRYRGRLTWWLGRAVPPVPYALPESATTCHGTSYRPS